MIADRGFYARADIPGNDAMTKKQQGKSAKGPGRGQRQMHVRVKTAAKRTTSSQRWLHPFAWSHSE